MEIIPYKLYLGDDIDNYDNPIPCYNLEQVEYELNKAIGYTKYILLEYNLINKNYEFVCAGRIELNRTHTKKGR